MLDDDDFDALVELLELIEAIESNTDLDYSEEDI